MTTSFFPFLLLLAELALAFLTLSPSALDLLVGVAAEVDEGLGGGEAESHRMEDCDGYEDRSNELV